MSRKQIQNTVEAEMASQPQALSPRMRVIRSIRQWIDEGELIDGDRLPAEMALARKFDVSRDTVRAALKQLEQQGLLSISRNRSRQVVAQPKKHSAGQSLMSKSIAVLGSFGRPGQQYASSNMGMVQQEAVEQIAKSGWHAIQLQPQQVAEEGFAKQLLADPPAGLLIAEGVVGNDQARALVEKFIQDGVPVVINDDDPDLAGCDHVIFDHYTGSHMITEHLIQLGAKNIVPLFLCDMNRTWAQKRLAGYQAAMQESGLDPMAATWIDVHWDQTISCPDEKRFELQTRLFVGYLLPLIQSERVPDAIITINDGHTYPIAAACRILGLEPNVDIKIAGYDNSWMNSFEIELEPTRPIVTVDKNNPQAGHEMVQLLVDRLEKRLPDQPHVRKIKPLLVIPAVYSIIHD